MLWPRTQQNTFGMTRDMTRSRPILIDASRSNYNLLFSGSWLRYTLSGYSASGIVYALCRLVSNPTTCNR